MTNGELEIIDYFILFGEQLRPSNIIRCYRLYRQSTPKAWVYVCISSGILSKEIITGAPFVRWFFPDASRVWTGSGFNAARWILLECRKDEAYGKYVIFCPINPCLLNVVEYEGGHSSTNCV